MSQARENLTHYYAEKLIHRTVNDSNSSAYFISKVWSEVMLRIAEAESASEREKEQIAFFEALATLPLPPHAIRLLIEQIYISTHKPYPHIKFEQAIQLALAESV